MNYKKLPKSGEVEVIGDFQIVELTDENRSHVLEVALSMYANEPCRICGELITENDVRNNAVFAGYSADSKARSAHKTCWNSNTPKAQWAYPNDEVQP